MNKKTNTILFVIGGTLFNILVMIVSFLLLLVIYARVFFPLLPESSGPWVMPIIFVASVVNSFFVYRLAIKILMKKVDMEKYIDPIFRSRR